MIRLPIDPHVDEARSRLDRHGCLVLVAPPGSGKTTRVPPALLGPGPLILLQPRRVAARSLARRIATEQGLTLGREVGWHVRFEREFSPATRLLVATEGILNARLARDPLLSDFATVVLDEFHERSLHADLALALVRQAREARGDLRVLVMSATLDAGPVASYLGAAVLEVAASPHPVEISFAPGLDVAPAVRRVLSGPGGHVLAFLPGAREIRDAAQALAGLDVRPLHGSLPPDEQDRALAPCEGRKVILATNVAETSLTVDGVTDVVDSGLQRVLRYDPERAIDRLVTERVALDSAVQRAGRAGRTGPGRALRLWDERDRLRPRREPEVARVDLAPPLLEVLAWGGDPLSFPWFEAPPGERVRASLDLLRRLGAFDGRALTPLGETLRRFPLHPRLARVLVAAGGGARAAAACAVLSERPFLRPDGLACDSDVLQAVDRLRDAPPGLRQAAREIADLARRLVGPPRDVSDDDLRRALCEGFPDRLAQRRSPRSPRLLMISGSGAVLGRESGVHDGEFLVALDVAGGDSGEPVVRQASRVDPEWLAADGRQVFHRLEEGRVRAVLRETLGALVLAERHVAPDPEQAARLLGAALLPATLEGELARRIRFAGVEVDLPALLEQACLGATEMRQVDVGVLLPHAVRRDLDRLAPERLPLPSGRSAAIEYREDGTAVAEVKLQELFGLAQSPRLGPRQEPVLLALLAPNGRPVQLTRDLASFWERTYPEVRKELRGRYPRHPWPEDPWTAEPTHRTKRNRGPTG